MAILQLRVFCACLLTSSPALRDELTFALADSVPEVSGVIRAHLRARAIVQLWCLSQAASMPRVAGLWRWLAGAVS